MVAMEWECASAQGPAHYWVRERERKALLAGIILRWVWEGRTRHSQTYVGLCCVHILTHPFFPWAGLAGLCGAMLALLCMCSPPLYHSTPPPVICREWTWFPGECEAGTSWISRHMLPGWLCFTMSNSLCSLSLLIFSRLLWHLHTETMVSLHKNAPWHTGSCKWVLSPNTQEAGGYCLKAHQTYLSFIPARRELL